MGLERFEEIKVIGSRFSISVIEAKIFPEKTFIRDLIENRAEMAIVISEQEYLELSNKAHSAA